MSYICLEFCNAAMLFLSSRIWQYQMNLEMNYHKDKETKKENTS